MTENTSEERQGFEAPYGLRWCVDTDSSSMDLWVVPREHMGDPDDEDPQGSKLILAVSLSVIREDPDFMTELQEASINMMTRFYQRCGAGVRRVEIVDDPPKDFRH